MNPLLPNCLGQQQQQQPKLPSNLEALYNAVFNCRIHGDERDSILSRWNLLQALWGTGKGYYSPTLPPYEFTMQNPLCRFKAIGYSSIPASDNKDGLVAMIFNKKEEEIKSQLSQLILNMNVVLGNKPNIILTVETVRPTSETKTQVVIFVIEKGPNDAFLPKRIPATELASYLLQPFQKQQLSQLGVENIYPQIIPDKEQLDEYLANAPYGIDPRLWKQARLDNPNPEKFVPVPMVGFADVHWRLKCQEQETLLHHVFLERLGEEIGALHRRHTAMLAIIAEHRRRLIDLEHRILKVLVAQEVSRKANMALQPEEELLRCRIATLLMQLGAPFQFKAKLNDLVSLIRTHNIQSPNKDADRYNMDPSFQNEVKQFLLLEQNGMAHLVDILQSDVTCVKIIKEGLLHLLQS